MAWWSRAQLHPKTKSKFVVVFGNEFFLPNVKTIVKPKIDFDTKEYKLINHKFNYPGNGTWQPVDIKFVDMNGLAAKSGVFDTAAFLWQILNNTGYAYPFMDVDSATSTNPYYKKIVEGQVSTEHGHYINTEVYFQDQSDTPGFKEGEGWRTLTTPEKSSTIANSFGGGLAGRRDEQEAHYSRQKISIYQISPEHPEDNGSLSQPPPEGAIITEAWHLVNPIVKSIDWGDLSYDSDELVEYDINIVYDWAIYDRDSIGKSIYDLGYNTEIYDKFTKEWNNLSDRVEAEIQRQRMELVQEAAAAARQEFEGYGLDLDALEEFKADRFIDGAIDLNDDGVIDDYERAFAASEQYLDFVEDLELARDEAEALVLEVAEAVGQEAADIITQNTENQTQGAGDLGDLLGDAIEQGEFDVDINDIVFDPEATGEIQAGIDERRAQADRERRQREFAEGGGDSSSFINLNPERREQIQEAADEAAAQAEAESYRQEELLRQQEDDEERNRTVVDQDETGRDVTYEEVLLRQQAQQSEARQQTESVVFEATTDQTIEDIFQDDQLPSGWAEDLADEQARNQEEIAVESALLAQQQRSQQQQQQAQSEAIEAAANEIIEETFQDDQLPAGWAEDLENEEEEEEYDWLQETPNYGDTPEGQEQALQEELNRLNLNSQDNSTEEND